VSSVQVRFFLAWFGGGVVGRVAGTDIHAAATSFK
jgi:hypothetical protein